MTPAELRTKWLAALRSGEYAQGRGRLKNNSDEFCCLGVACDVSGLGKWVCSPRGMPAYLIEGDSVRGLGLPSALRYKLGLTNDQEDELINYNDSDKMTFTQIADRIEAGKFDPA